MLYHVTTIIKDKNPEVQVFPDMAQAAQAYADELGEIWDNVTSGKEVSALVRVSEDFVLKLECLIEQKYS